MNGFYKIEFHGPTAAYEAEAKRYDSNDLLCGECIVRNFCNKKDAKTCEDTFREFVVHVPPQRWRTASGRKYWCIHSSGCIEEFAERCSDYDDRRYTLGNYFRTEKDAIAAKAAIAAALEKWHAEQEGASDD